MKMKRDTPLHCACKYKGYKVIEVLLTLEKRIDVNSKNYEQLTPLLLLCKHSSHRVPMTILEMMIKFGAFINSKDLTGGTALHYSAATGKSKWCEYLLSKNAAIDEADTNNETALHYAIRYGENRVVQMLVQVGADVNIYSNNVGTPIEFILKRRETLQRQSRRPIPNNR